MVVGLLFSSAPEKLPADAPSALPNTSLTTPHTANIIVKPGWNLISLPVDVGDGRRAELFPTSTSPAFEYVSSYVESESLQTGVGYWLKFAATETVAIAGQLQVNKVLQLNVGWNLIGTVGLPIATSELTTSPPNIIITNYFHYDADTDAYAIVDTLVPGEGYWVKSSQAGTLQQTCWDFELVAPPVNYKSVSIPQLKWRGSVCVNSYRLQVAQDSMFTSMLIDSLVNDTLYNFPYCSTDSVYYWRVGVSASESGTSWSGYRRFTWAYAIGGLVYPQDNGGTTMTPYLIWRSASCASIYQVQLSLDSLFQNLVVDTSLADTVYQTMQLDSAQTYYWRTGLPANGGDTLWTLPQSFIVSWKYLGLGDGVISSIVIDWSNPDIIYAGGYGLFKSTNTGVSWDTLIQGVGVGDLHIHPSNPSIIYAMIGNRIRKSIDAGLTWASADSGIILDPESSPRVLAINPIHPETLYAAIGGFGSGIIFKSTNGGNYWFQQDIPTFPDINTIVIDPLHPETLYVGSSSLGDNYKTTNGGVDWIMLPVPSDHLVIKAIDPIAPETLYAGSNHGVYISPNGGLTWQQSNNGLPMASPLYSGGIYINPADPTHIYVDVFVASSGFTLYKRTSTGGDWEILLSPFDGTYVRFAMPPSGSSLYVGAAGIYKYLLTDF